MERGVVVMASDHPSLEPAVARFAAGLRAESRYFGRRGVRAERPGPSSVRRLTATRTRLRVAAVIDGEVIGIACIDETAPDGPELLIAVSAPWRGKGVALALGQVIVTRAYACGLPRIVIRTSHRASDVREMGSQLGFQVFDLGRGRLDLVRQFDRTA